MNSNLKKLLNEVCYVVEADSFARLMLWKENQEWRPANKRVSWHQESIGYSENIGHINNKPIDLDLSFTLIDNKRIMFYCTCSNLADRQLAETWIKHNCHSGIQICDAMNFHLCLHAIANSNTRAAELETLEQMRTAIEDRLENGSDSYALNCFKDAMAKYTLWLNNQGPAK